MSSNLSLYANDSQSCFSGTPEEYIHFPRDLIYLSPVLSYCLHADNVQIDTSSPDCSLFYGPKHNLNYLPGISAPIIKGPLRLNLFKIKLIILPLKNMFLLCFTHSLSKYLLSTYYLLWLHHPAKLEGLDSPFYPHNQSTSHVYPTSSIPIYCPAFSPALLKLPAITHSPVILHTEWCFLFLKHFHGSSSSLDTVHQNSLAFPTYFSCSSFLYFPHICTPNNPN